MGPSHVPSAVDATPHMRLSASGAHTEMAEGGGTGGLAPPDLLLVL
jgi:hypothetical protein